MGHLSREGQVSWLHDTGITTSRSLLTGTRLHRTTTVGLGASRAGWGKALGCERASRVSSLSLMP